MVAEIELVQRRHLVAVADLAAVDAVVAEVLVRHLAVLVPDLPPGQDRLLRELELDLHVPGDGREVRDEVAAEHPRRLRRRVDVVVVAVALVRDPDPGLELLCDRAVGCCQRGGGKPQQDSHLRIRRRA